MDKEKLYETFPLYNYLSIGFTMETHETCKILLNLGVTQKKINKWIRKKSLEWNFHVFIDEEIGYSIIRDNNNKIIIMKIIDKYIDEEDHHYELNIGRLNKEINEFSNHLKIDTKRIKIYTGSSRYI